MEGWGDYYGVTSLHPIGLLAVLILGYVLLVAPRRYVVLPMLIMACFIPSAQRLIVLGADFTLLRILVLFAWARLFLRNEFQGFSWNRLDTMVVAWKMSGTIVFTIANGTLSAFINRCGWMFDGVGMYFFFRCALQNWSDLYSLFRYLTLISFPVAAAFLFESMTARNVFSVFGGVPAITFVREGKLRCQGAYSHAILAGCFWAGVAPWMLSTYHKNGKLVVAGGLTCIMLIVSSCASSTPILACVFAVIGMLLYRVRSHMRLVRWGFLLTLIILHFARDKPVWHLISRVNVVGGSTGWHRFRIMDATINNFSEWWLWGETDPMSWGVWEMRDITNQYILEALRGGGATLLCYILMIGFAFSLVGKALRHLNEMPRERLVVWSVGTALFVHVCIYFSVSYFGQIMMMWYLTLAIIGSLPSIITRQNHLSKGGV